MIDEEVIRESSEVVCPTCGGSLKFDIDNQNLKCSYCDSLVDISPFKSDIKFFNYEEFLVTSKENDYANENHIIHCDSCGGNTILGKKEISKSCSFCGSVFVVELKELSGIKPQYIIPFKINVNQLNKIFSNWRKSIFWAPKEFKKIATISHINSIYLPFWSYQYHTSSNYSALKGTHYYITKTTTVNGKTTTVQERETSWTRVIGIYDKLFKNILISGSSNYNQKIIRNIGKFNTEELLSYDKGFIAGYNAEHYSIDLEAGYLKSTEIVRGYLTEEIKKTIGGDDVAQLTFNTKFTERMFRLFLVPLYLAALTYKNKSYQFGVNGQTGKIYGSYPISKIKVFITIIILIIFFTAIFIIYS